MQDEAARHHARRSLTLARTGRSTCVAALALLGAVLVHGCVEPAPKIPSIPMSGLSLRVYAFGASAEGARRAFESVRQSNPQFHVVNSGGDGDVLVGLENDSPKCVPPTALCSYKVSYRVRDNKGEILNAATTIISASSEHCSDLCTKALVNVAVKVVETAAGLLKPGGDADASATVESNEAGTATGAAPASDGAIATVVDAGPPPPAAKGAKKGGGKAVEPPPKPQPAICSVAAGPRLPADEAEKRAAQVEVLKRLSVIDQDEYDCLRKAYLARL